MVFVVFHVLFLEDLWSCVMEKILKLESRWDACKCVGGSRLWGVLEGPFRPQDRLKSVLIEPESNLEGVCEASGHKRGNVNAFLQLQKREGRLPGTTQTSIATSLGPRQNHHFGWIVDRGDQNLMPHFQSPPLSGKWHRGEEVQHASHRGAR